MRARMMLIILFTTIVFIADCGRLLSLPPASPWTMNGAELADGILLADGTRQI
jgi:hypothetical protein